MAKSVNKRINIYINGKEVENNIKSVRAAMQKLINEQAKMTIGSDEYVEHSKKIRQLREIYEQHRKELKMTGEEMDKLGKKSEDILLWGAGSAVFTGAVSMLEKVSAAISEHVEAYATLDDALSAVRKTTGMTSEEVQALYAALSKVDTRTATNELLAIAEQGGRLGLAKEDIEAFTEAVDKANVALGDSFSGGAQEIATVLGKIRNAYKEVNTGDVGDAFNRIGSVINELGASSAASEGNIANFTQRVGAMPDVFKPTVQEAMALAAAFEENSVDAEVASRSYGILFKTAAADIDKFAAAMGEPAEAMRELINADPTAFALRFAESLKGLNATETAEYLKNLGLNADGVSKALGALSNNTDRVREMIQIANTAFEEGTSLQNEFNTVNENTAAQLDKAKKAVTDASAALGETLAPVLISITNGTASTMKAMASLAKVLLSNKAAVAALTVAWTAYWVLSKKVQILEKAKAAQIAITTTASNVARTATLLFAAAQATLAKNTTRAAAAQKLLKAAFASTPWGAILTAITTIASGVALFVSNARKAKKEQEELAGNTKEAVTQINDFGVATDKEIKSAKALFDKLSTLTKGTKDYNTVQAQILKLYPELLARQVDEKGNILDIAAAYDEVVRAIQDKMATQMKEKDVENAWERYYENTKNLFAALPAALRQQARQLADAGKSAAEILTELFPGNSLLGNGDVTYDGTYAMQISYIVEQRKKLTSDLETIDSQYSAFLKSDAEKQAEQDAIAAANRKKQKKQQQQELSAEEQKAWNAYRQRVARFRETNRVNQLADWEKTKAQISAQYDELIKEAAKYGARGKAIAATLEKEKGEAIIAAGEKYLQKYGDFLTRFQEKTTKMAKSGQLDGAQSKVIADIMGSNEAWDEKIAAIRSNIESLQTLLADMTTDDANYEPFNAMLEQMVQQLGTTMTQKAEAAANVVEKYAREGYDFVKKEQTALTNAQLSDYQRELAAIDERYDAEVQGVREVIEAKRQLMANGGDIAELTAQINELETLIETMEDMRGQTKAGVKNTSPASTVSAWERLFQLMNMPPDEFAQNWQSALQTMIGCLQYFADTALSIYSSINEVQTNREQAELERFNDLQDAKLDALQHYYDQGTISEKFYNAQKEKLEADKEKKEKEIQHAQFERNKKASIVEATIQGTLAAVTSFAQLGFPWGLIPMAMSLATTAAQIAAISSQANPYAKGGWIKGKQLILAGEAGDEWVASNKLLEDRRTRPVINALEEYQRGNTSALSALRVPAPDQNALSKSATSISRTFAESKPVVNNYYGADNDGALLKEMRRMNQYLSDPKNRQAYITRKQQLEFDKQESEIKKYARL